MTSNCRHIMPSGRQCHGYALQGGNLCYFHSRRRLAAQKTLSPADSIEIPLLEDRCAIQVTITQVLRAIASNTLDRPRASLLLYGLQLALQSVDRNSYAIPFGTVEALSQTSDGDELATDPDDDGGDEDDDEEAENFDQSGDDSGADELENSDGGSDDEDGEENEDGDSDDDDDEDDGLDGQTTEELIADRKYLQSVSNALDAGDMRRAARLLAKSAP